MEIKSSMLEDSCKGTELTCAPKTLLRWDLASRAGVLKRKIENAGTRCCSVMTIVMIETRDMRAVLQFSSSPADLVNLRNLMTQDPMCEPYYGDNTRNGMCRVTSGSFFVFKCCFSSQLYTETGVGIRHHTHTGACACMRHTYSVLTPCQLVRSERGGRPL